MVLGVDFMDVVFLRNRDVSDIDFVDYLESAKFEGRIVNFEIQLVYCFVAFEKFGFFLFDLFDNVPETVFALLLLFNH